MRDLTCGGPILGGELRTGAPMSTDVHRTPHPDSRGQRFILPSEEANDSPWISVALMTDEFILVLTCPDRPGIVGAVGTLLADNGCNILDSAQFCDASGNAFMMRVVFESLARERD